MPCHFAGSRGAVEAVDEGAEERHVAELGGVDTGGQCVAG